MHLVRLDEPHARHAVVVDKEPQKRLAVAIDPPDDLLLPQLPAILALELVEHLLHRQRDIRPARPCLCRRRPIAVARADDVADPVLVPVDRELIRRRQPPALARAARRATAR